MRDDQPLKAPGFIDFITRPVGRWLRVITGFVLISVGLNLQSTTGTILAVIGLLPLAGGIFNFCTFGPLFNGYFSGRKMRAKLERDRQSRTSQIGGTRAA